MRVAILYRPNSEHARRTEEYIIEFNRFHPGGKLEVLNVDSIEGSKMAQLYGIIEYPALLALASDGQMQQMWQGENFPLMNDLAYFVNL